MQHRPEGRLAAVGDLQLAVAVAQPRADHADLAGGRRRTPRVGRACIGGTTVSLFRKNRYRPAARCGRLVAGPGEPEVLGVADQHDSRELARDHVGGAVGGGVVHDDHFDRHALRGRRAASRGSRAGSPGSSSWRCRPRRPGAAVGRPAKPRRSGRPPLGKGRCGDGASGGGARVVDMRPSVVQGASLRPWRRIRKRVKLRKRGLS